MNLIIKYAKPSRVNLHIVNLQKLDVCHVQDISSPFKVASLYDPVLEPFWFDKAFPI